MPSCKVKEFQYCQMDRSNAVQNFNYFKYIKQFNNITNIEICHILKLKNFDMKQASWNKDYFN